MIVKYFLRSVVMTNKSIREYAKKKGVYLWQIAKEMGISEPTMTRRMRSELSEQEQENIMSIIKKLSEQEKTA